jgi:glycerol kinase
VAWSRNGGVQYALEGHISVSGQAAAFATTLLGLADEDALTASAASVPDSAGVVFVPALAGLGAPYWCSGARGAISGMSLGTRPAHVARATLEAIALEIGDVVAAIEADLGTVIPELSVDGGGARNPLLMQMLADLLDKRIVRPRVTEASALGVARLAREALGLARHEGGSVEADRFEPLLAAEQRDSIRRNWNTAVALAMAPAAPDQEAVGAAQTRRQQKDLAGP